MNLRKLVFAAWTVIAVTVFASVAFGKNGILAMRKLESERDRIASNMLELRRLNGELEGALGSLQSDPDTLTVYARELGFSSSDDDRFVRISGVQAAPRRTTPAGNLLKAVRPDAIPDDWIRTIALLSGLCVFVVLLSRQKPRRSRRHAASGGKR